MAEAAFYSSVFRYSAPSSPDPGSLPAGGSWPPLLAPPAEELVGDVEFWPKQLQDTQGKRGPPFLSPSRDHMLCAFC